MRSFLGILGLVAVAIGLAYFSSHLHPGGDLPPLEAQADKDQADADAAKKKAEDRKAQIAHGDAGFETVKAGAIQTTLVFDGKAPITLELYPAAAPKTVAHITDLIKQHFYDGIKVHRLEDGSKGLKLIQFGDPESIKVDPKDFTSKEIGKHGSGTTVPLEVKLSHVKYSVGLARAQSEDSGDAQLYINTGDNTHLDGNYCIFGRVIGGQDVLPTVKLGDKIQSFNLK